MTTVQHARRLSGIAISLAIVVAVAVVAYTVASAPVTRVSSALRGTLLVKADACESLTGPLVPTAVVSVWRGSRLVARQQRRQGGSFAFRLDVGRYRVTSMDTAPPSRPVVQPHATTRVFLPSVCGRRGQPAATATPSTRPDGRLASVVIVGNQDERLLPPPPWAAPLVTREQAMRDGTSSVGLGFFTPLDPHPTAIAYLAMLSERGPNGRAIRAHMVWIVEYPHARFAPDNGPCCHALGVDTYPYFLVVNPATGLVRQTFGGPVRVRTVVGPPRSRR